MKNEKQPFQEPPVRKLDESDLRLLRWASLMLETVDSVEQVIEEFQFYPPTADPFL